MRIQMKLSRVTIIAMEEYKRLKFKGVNTRIMQGYLVGMAYKSIHSRLSEIDWPSINNAIVPNVTDAKGNEKEVLGQQTALNLEAEVLEGIEALQAEFMTVFGTKKMYKPFVIKCILLAAILQEYHSLPCKKQNDMLK